MPCLSSRSDFLWWHFLHESSFSYQDIQDARIIVKAASHMQLNVLSGWIANNATKASSQVNYMVQYLWKDCREFKFFPKQFALGVLNATFVLVVVSASVGLCLLLSQFVSYLWWLCRLPWAFVSSCCFRLFLLVRFCHFGAPFLEIVFPSRRWCPSSLDICLPFVPS